MALGSGGLADREGWQRRQAGSTPVASADHLRYYLRRSSLTERDASARMPRPPKPPPVQGPTDSTVELFQRARAGDADAEEAFITRMSGPLDKYAHGRLPKQARGELDTQDVRQEVLLQFWKRKDEFDPKHAGAPRGYLRQAALNRIRDEGRRAKRRPVSDAPVDELPSRAPTQFERATAQESRRQLNRSLAELSAVERRAIGLRSKGLGFAEIGRRIGKSAAATRMLVKRATDRMRSKLPR